MQISPSNTIECVHYYFLHCNFLNGGTIDEACNNNLPRNSLNNNAKRSNKFSMKNGKTKSEQVMLV